jgi:hypothetical protein
MQRRAEVGNLDVAAAALRAVRRIYQQDVGRLDVAMGDAGAKGIVERARAFEDHLHQAVDRQQVLAYRKVPACPL